MTEKELTPGRDRTDNRPDAVGRRTFIAASGSVGATVFAGCTSEGSTDGSSDDAQSDETQADGSTGAAHDGNFRLLISDLPADIGDFDRLDVSFDSARIFDGGEGEDEASGDQGETDDDHEDADDEPEAADDADNGDEATGDEDGVERKRGFYVLDLEDETVDLTDVIGDRAVSVFEGELSPGTYGKIELHVSEIEGIVDGEQATVKVPSEKLQITHPFEISADEPVGFVFDINVVKRGQGNSYNLKPVISESGVAGEDVDVEEVDGDGEDDEQVDGESDSADDGEGDGEEKEGGEGTEGDGSDADGSESTGENGDDTGDE